MWLLWLYWRATGDAAVVGFGSVECVVVSGVADAVVVVMSVRVCGLLSVGRAASVVVVAVVIVGVVVVVYGLGSIVRGCMVVIGVIVVIVWDGVCSAVRLCCPELCGRFQVCVVMGVVVVIAFSVVPVVRLCWNGPLHWCCPGLFCLAVQCVPVVSIALVPLPVLFIMGV